MRSAKKCEGIKMAGRKPSIPIAEKIKRAEDALLKSKAKYDADAAVLRDLLEKQRAIRNKELIAAVANSTRTFDEIMEFIESKPVDEP